MLGLEQVVASILWAVLPLIGFWSCQLPIGLGLHIVYGGGRPYAAVAIAISKALLQLMIARDSSDASSTLDVQGQGGACEEVQQPGKAIGFPIEKANFS